ncbi:MAG: hypothetical protein ACRD3W_01975, partial [Terriglobales bacterium]
YADNSYIITSAPGRYAQYKLTWKPEGGTAGGAALKPVTIGKVEVTYLPSNVAPEFSTISLKTGTACNGKQEVTVKASDPDNDNLALAVEVSPDGGKTWQSITSDLRTHQTKKESHASEEKRAAKVEKKSASPDAPEEKKETESGGKEKSVSGPEVNSTSYSESSTNESAQSDDSTQLDAKPSEKEDEKPSDPEGKDKDKGSKDKDKEAKHEEGGQKGDSSSDKTADKDKENKETDKKTQVSKENKSDKTKGKKLPPGQPLAQLKPPDASGSGEKFSWNWDTAKVKDGNYLIKFTLDDIPSNPSGHLQTVALRTIEVDNTPPEIQSVKLSHDKEKKAHILVKAYDKQTPIVNATYRFDEGEPFALGGQD